MYEYDSQHEDEQLLKSHSKTNHATVLAQKFLPDTQEFRLHGTCTELFPVPYYFLTSLRGICV